MDYLSKLNPVQQEAVQQTEGPVMIVAGAGSGKTRVLTYRIAHLLQQGNDAFNVLALTFTNKAAKEMKERINSIVGNNEARNLWMGTFHSVFAKILRVEADRLAYPSNFTIYDTDDSKGLIKDILKGLALDDKTYKPSLVLNRISTAKTNLISASAYNNNSTVITEDRASGRPMLGEIYKQYEKRLFKAGAMDFDDLLFKTNVLLRDFPDVLHKYQRRFKYIMVDEYQDTNFSQYVIIKQLAAMHLNICVVGDDAQSIYAFRGANIQNILNFEKDYPDLRTFKLEQNYRSTKNIVNAANSVIAKNRDQIQKEVWTQNDEGETIKVMRAYSDNEEGQTVTRTIWETQQNNQRKHSDFAILYRTNAQSRAFEEALRKMNMPYKIYGGISFYHRKEIKDVLAYFRLAINPHDEESLKRVINYPARGIGQTTIDKIIVAAADNDVSVWTTLENIKEFGLDINSGTASKIGDFVALINTFRSMLSIKDAFEVGNHIAVASGILKDLYNDKTPEGVARHENIQELLNGVKEFVEKDSPTRLTPINPDDTGSFGEETPLKTLDQFMEDIALLTDADRDDDEDRDKVSLMTIHAAKGLEFPYVFIVGVEENLFPSQMTLNSREDLEEERRLFYVALTRAEKQAFISYATTRYKWGTLTTCEPSRFIEEIDPKYLDLPIAAENMYNDDPVIARKTWNGGYNRSTTAKPAASPAPPKPSIPRNLVKASQAKATAPINNDHLKDLQVGMNVEHERFGLGQVTVLEGVYPNSKATVQFKDAGSKQLLLKFARLKIVQ